MTTQIESAQNPRLKAVRRLHTKRERALQGRFLAEGEDLIAAAQMAGRPALEGLRLSGTEIGGEQFFDVERSALARVSALGSGTRVIGVYEQRWGPAVGPLCVYLHGVKDPGNIGTVLRSALAFGASCVAFGPGCADPHGPKAVRASMGAIFTVALARVSDISELPGERIALDAAAEQPLSEVREGHREAVTREGRQEPVTLLVGSEREGLPAELLAGSEHRARIPIAGDSLNAAMAATVALYEMTRRSGRDNDTVPAS